MTSRVVIREQEGRLLNGTRLDFHLCEVGQQLRVGSYKQSIYIHVIARVKTNEREF